MMGPLDLFAEPVGQRLTWTLLHFLWQGLAIAAALPAMLWLLKVRRARVRYALCLAAMLTMAVCPLVTFALLQADVMQMPLHVDVGWDAAQRSPTPTRAKVTPPPGPSPATHASEPSTAAATPSAPPPIPTEATSHGRPARPPMAATSGLRPADYVRAAQPYLLVGWIAGVLLLSWRWLLSLAGVHWLRRGRRPIPPELACCAAGLAERLGLRSVVRVFTSERVHGAVVVGLLRPMVLLPASWLMEMTPEVFEAVIAHELAHIRRWDLGVNLFQRLVETLLFYHPAVWWLSRRIRLEREMCCDELAVAATGRPAAYATALEQAASKRLATIWPELEVAMGGKNMVMLNRVRNVLGLPPTRETARWWPVGLATLMALAAIWWISIGVSSFGEEDALAQEERPGVETRHAEEPLAETGPQPRAPDESETAQPYRVKPLDLLTIQAIGTIVDQPIDQVYWVEPSGRVSLGPVYGRVELTGLTLEESEITITKHLRRVLADPKVQVVLARRLTRLRSAILPKAPYQIRTYDALAIRVAGTIPGQPIDVAYLVEGSGHVELGPTYGRVLVRGSSFEEAEQVIQKHLKTVLADCEVSVTLLNWRTESWTEWRTAATLKSPYRVATADLLEIAVDGTLLDQPIAGTYLVEPNGRVALGPAYGRVRLDGLTLQEAEDTITNHLKKILTQPQVSVTLAGWKDEASRESESPFPAWKEMQETSAGLGDEVPRELRLSARLAVALELTTVHWKSFETGKSNPEFDQVVTQLTTDLRQNAVSNGWSLRFIETHRSGTADENLDEFEKQALAKIKAGEDEVWQRSTDGATRCVQAVRATNSTCVVCHNAISREPLEKNDVIATASLRLSANETRPTAP